MPRTAPNQHAKDYMPWHSPAACGLGAGAQADVGIFGAADSDYAIAWAYLHDIQDKVSSANTSAGLGLGSVVPHRLCTESGLTPACITTPTLAQLQRYTAVLVFANNPFPDSVALGNVLADYVNAGGTVVMAMYSLGDSQPNFVIQGRLVTENHLPVTVGSRTLGTSTAYTLNPTLPSHPLLQGVSGFSSGANRHHAYVSLSANATLVATASLLNPSNSPLIAVKGNVLALNFFPVSSDQFPNLWDASTDGGRIMANALAWATRLANPDLPAGRVSQPYADHTLSTLNAMAPLTWSAATGLPAGMTFAHGNLSGTPSQAGQWLMQTTFTDSHTPARNRAQTLSLTVHPADATAGQAYSQTLGSSGRYATQTMALTGLPAGLSFNRFSKTISGTATEHGSFPLTLNFLDNSQSPAVISSTHTLMLEVLPPLPLTLAPSALPTATAGQPYTQSVAPAGGVAPWSLSATGLPHGLSLNPSTGAIAGTPTEHGSFSPVITITDSSSPTAHSTQHPISLDVLPPLTVSPNTWPTATLGRPYSQAIAATGGVAPLTLSVTGLPAGLSFDASAGLITGTPTAHGSATVSIAVSDNQSPAATQTTTLTLDVVPAALTLSPSALPAATVGQPYRHLCHRWRGTVDLERHRPARRPVV